uniref:Uncharacterized protein n=1 Tax=Rheinheimera sp. BAL341 TaxID=1708203 RepID=A0A486XN21_9GAMM
MLHKALHRSANRYKPRFVHTFRGDKRQEIGEHCFYIHGSIHG